MKVWGDPGAPAIVFWPGFLGTDAAGAEIGPAFAARRRQLVAVNPLELGGDWALPALADAVAALAPLRFVMMGHSYGARVASQVAVRHADRLDALVLLDGAFVDPDELGDEGLEERVRATREEHAKLAWDDWDAFVEFATRDARRDLTPLLASMREWLVERDGKLRPPHDEDTVEAMIRGAAPYLSRETFPAIRASGIPVLLLRASEPPERNERLRPYDERFARELPDAEVQYVPNAGHDLLWDVGAPLADLVADWLDRARGDDLPQAAP